MDVKELINHVPKQVTPYFDIRIYPKGSSTLVPDAKGSSLYLLPEGTAKVCQYTLSGMFISLYQYGKNNYFSEVELYCGNRTAPGVPAIDICRIVEFSREGVKTWIHEDNGFCEFLLRQMVLKITENSDAYIKSSSMKLKDRVLYCLYRHDRMGTLSDPTKERPMSEIYTPIRSLNRVLAQYREEDLVVYNGHRFRTVGGERFLDVAGKLAGGQK